MPDRMTPKQRHRCMSHIHSSGTKPEKAVRSWLWRHGYRYRLNVKSVLGKPDIVMRKYRTAIFVNGCFWHGHEGCKDFVMPKSNVAFWQSKIDRKRERDRQNCQILADNGWQVIVIWACELKEDLERTMSETVIALNRNYLRIVQNKKRPIPPN
ncbi:MAG: very short patch repair endonuclease [Bacteroidales bacterium]|nr:very short patch repair endonuclease [Candidatus Colicola coprequi]